ncbi:MAG: TMEM175 family protein [Dehalococcoidia bacterium]
MTADPSNQSGPTPISDGRLISLSDGVFAFAMTLMVITLDVPKPDSVTTAELPRAVQRQWPEFLGYGLTFWIIATFWFVHRRFFRQIVAEDVAVGWLNIAFLFCIVFLPYPTDMMGDFEQSRFALIFYATTMIVTSAILSVLWEYSRRRGLMAKSVVEREHFSARLRSALIPSVMLLSIALSFFSLAAARISWTLILVGEIVLKSPPSDSS